jgi:hypothetical protein
MSEGEQAEDEFVIVSHRRRTHRPFAETRNTATLDRSKGPPTQMTYRKLPGVGRPQKRTIPKEDILNLVEARREELLLSTPWKQFQSNLNGTVTSSVPSRCNELVKRW